MQLETKFKLGIIGSRRRSTLFDRKIVFTIVEKAIKKCIDNGQQLIIVSGGARGPDTFAEEAADFYTLDKIIHLIPEGPEHFAKRAYFRNGLIAQDSDIVFALVHQDRKGGTENTIEHCLNLKKKVFIVDDQGLIYLP